MPSSVVWLYHRLNNTPFLASGLLAACSSLFLSDGLTATSAMFRQIGLRRGPQGASMRRIMRQKQPLTALDALKFPLRSREMSFG